MQLGMRGITERTDGEEDAEGEMKAAAAMMHSDVYGLLLLLSRVSLDHVIWDLRSSCIITRLDTFTNELVININDHFAPSYKRI